MDKFTISFSANAGICLTTPGGHRVWFDLLHQIKQGEFSPVLPETWADIKESPEFSSPDVICFTHCHNDHYSYKMTQEAHALWPDAKLILPEYDFDDQLLLTGPELLLRQGELNFRFVRTIHSGEESQIPHYSVFLEENGHSVFYSGDLTGPTPELEALLRGLAPDIAFMPFTWTTLVRGRKFLEEIFRPRHLVLLHLPSVADDIYHYRDALEQCLTKPQAVPDIRVMGRSGHQEIVML